MSVLKRNNLRQRQKNSGKVLFIAMRKEIDTLLSEGFSRRAIYDELQEKAGLTISYRSFCEYLQEKKPDKKCTMEGENIQVLQQKDQESLPDKFIHCTFNINDLV